MLLLLLLLLLKDYVNENKQEERRCLEQVEELFDKYNKEKNCPIAAAIIEPIQSEGGDHFSYDNYSCCYYYCCCCVQVINTHHQSSSVVYRIFVKKLEIINNN